MLVAGHRQKTPEQNLAEWFAARAKEGGETVWDSYLETKKAFGDQPVGAVKVSERQQLDEYLANKDDINFWNKFLDDDNNGMQPETRNARAYQYVAEMARLHQKYNGVPIDESVEAPTPVAPQPSAEPSPIPTPPPFAEY